MRGYFLTIALCFVIGGILAYIFKTDPTIETTFLVACCALYRCYDKEG